MTRNAARCLGLLIAMMLLNHLDAVAQTIGTFRWQFAPFCNTVTLTISQVGAVYRLEGYDDRCGAAVRAPANGTAHLNPDGTVSMGITVIRPDGISIHHNASLALPALTGSWSDEYGNSGVFAFGAPSPSPGAPRPVTIRGEYSTRVNAPGPGQTAISFGRGLSFEAAAELIPLGGPATPNCPGAEPLPLAAPGYSCVYERFKGQVGLSAVLNYTFTPRVADRTGAIVIFDLASGASQGHVIGSWAVTIP